MKLIILRLTVYFSFSTTFNEASKSLFMVQKNNNFVEESQVIYAIFN